MHLSATLPAAPDVFAKGSRGRWQGAAVVTSFAVIALLAACARDSEAALREKLEQWFVLGETAFFVSQPRCTGAMIALGKEAILPETVVHVGVNSAQIAFEQQNMVAIGRAHGTPAELADALLLSGTGTFGRQALSASALAVSCFKGTEVGELLYGAFHRPGATLAFDRESAGLILIDPVAGWLFYVAGDVW